MQDRTVGVILAGGMGRRLEVLTSDVRAQSAVPFGGKYRIIDFVVSNFFNSNIKKIFVLIQHKSYSLVQHLEENWIYRFGSKEEYLRTLGPMPPHWQKGTADSVHQNISRIKIENPDSVAVFAGDHIYRMDIRKILEFHREKNAHLTICAIRYPIEKGTGHFGAIKRGKDARLTEFVEKSTSHLPIQGDESRMWISMGNYIFNKEVLIDALEYDSQLSQSESSHDFARDIIPRLMKKNGMRIFVYEFTGLREKTLTRGIREPGYWRDIGSVDSYYEASMDLVADRPLFDLYDESWPIYSINTDNIPPPKFFGSSNGKGFCISHSILSDGCILKGCDLEKSILSLKVEILEESSIKNSIIFDNVQVGKNCVIENAIIDKNVRVPEGTIIRDGKIKIDSSRGKKVEGQRKSPQEPDKNREIFRELITRAHTTDSGIVVIPRYYDLAVATQMQTQG